MADLTLARRQMPAGRRVDRHIGRILFEADRLGQGDITVLAPDGSVDHRIKLDGNRGLPLYD